MLSDFTSGIESICELAPEIVDRSDSTEKKEVVPSISYQEIDGTGLSNVNEEVNS